MKFFVKLFDESASLLPDQQKLTLGKFKELAVVLSMDKNQTLIGEHK
jgi:uncharacterized protein YueI